MHIIHGDLSPRSILLDSNMAPKITDIACSNNYRPDEHRGSLHGTMYELIKCTEQYSLRSKISVTDLSRFSCI
jgi:serine/threonine protein kinase